MARRFACERIITLNDLAACDCTLDKISPEMDQGAIDEVLDAACDALANIAQVPIGRCETVYRPCQDYCHYWGCPCGCGQQGIPLPGVMPTVTAITIDGVTVDENTYAVIRGPGGRYSLERFTLAGEPDSWPSQQMVALPTTMAGTFAITVESGLAADPLMKMAAAEIACDILTTLAGMRDVTDGVQSATVYGLTVSYARFGDPSDQETQHLAGLGQVRRFVAGIGAARIGAVTSNDLKRGWKLFEVA